MTVDNEVYQDLSSYFRTKLRKLILDTVNTCQIVDMKEEDIGSLIMTGLLFEMVASSLVLDINANDFARLCGNAYLYMKNEAEQSMEKRNGK